MHILNFPQVLDNKRKKAHPLKNFDVNFAPQIQTGSPTFARGDVTTIFSQLFKMTSAPSILLKKMKKVHPSNIFDVMSTNTTQKVGVPGRVWPRKDFSKKWKLITVFQRTSQLRQTFSYEIHFTYFFLNHLLNFYSKMISNTQLAGSLEISVNFHFPISIYIYIYIYIYLYIYIYKYIYINIYIKYVL